ncbi:hypothetical protein T484DRAFT_3642313 [Baffinella frigidus]|nr:hypothetical protein T484DRAFT_3642313 [Cryptophyta sp. CCMP2293]
MPLTPPQILRLDALALGPKLENLGGAEPGNLCSSFGGFGGSRPFLLNLGWGAGHAVFGQTDYLGRCGVNFGIGTGPLVIELWVKLPVVPLPNSHRQAVLFDYAKDPSTYGNNLMIWYQLDFKIRFNDVASYSPVTSGASFPSLWDGNWHHIAVTRKEVSGDCKYDFYHDGSAVGSTQARSGTQSCPEVSDGGCVTLGQNQVSECSGFSAQYALAKSVGTGSLSEVRVWNTWRSQPTILASKDVRMDETEAGLAAAWPLDCQHYYDDLLGNADLSGCSPASPSSTLPSFATEGLES